jgi:hypothetical protein
MAADAAADVAALHPARMGLTARPLEEWFTPQPGDAVVLAERAVLIACKRDAVVATLPESRDAVTELARMLAERNLCGSTEDDPRATMESLGRAIAEDICVLTRHGEGYRLTAAALCFPNRWRLSEKLGHGLTAVHGPVPDYAASLAAPVDRFLDRLRPMRLFVRENWGLATQAERHLPDPIPPVDISKPDASFVRIEAQSFVKLPETEAVIFAIRTTITPWRDVAENQRAALLTAIAGLSPAWLDYKSIVRR